MNWESMLNSWHSHPAVVVRVLLLLLAIPLTVRATTLLRRSLAKRLAPQLAMLVAKFVSYTLVAILLLTALREIGVKLTPLLGAAGVVGIAVGFAAQTSLSNLISGVFLILERPFEVGDLVRVDQQMGVVQSIDLLSVKLRAFDNTVTRIPNETMIKTPVTNVTAFPLRRMDITLGVAYKEDIERVMQLLREVTDAIPEILDEPEPLILFKGFADSALEFMLGVWFSNPDYIAVRNRLLPDIKARFDKEGVEIPFPHRTLYTGAASGPFPIRIVNETDRAPLVPPDSAS